MGLNYSDRTFRECLWLTRVKFQTKWSSGTSFWKQLINIVVLASWFWNCPSGIAREFSYVWGRKLISKCTHRIHCSLVYTPFWKFYFQLIILNYNKKAPTIWMEWISIQKKKNNIFFGILFFFYNFFITNLQKWIIHNF